MNVVKFFAQALLVELNKQIIPSTRYFPEDELLERLTYATRPNIPIDILREVMESFGVSGYTSVIDDEIGGKFVKLNYVQIHDRVQSDVNSQEGFLYRYSVIGAPLLSRVIEQLTDSPSPESELPTTTDPLEEIPASDRIVSRADNSNAITTIQEDIANVRKIIREDNEIGADLADAREVIELELEIADEVLQRPRFRLKSLLNWLLPALSFLADKFAGGAIGEVAKRLVALLLGLQ